MPKLLLVEDDVMLAKIVKASLESAKHHVDLTENGTEGFDWLKHEHYDTAIIDWELPGLKGTEICRQFRSCGGTTPILMITGKDKTKDLVEGLDSGADDFIAKPFELEELHARLRSLLRRSPHLDTVVVLKYGQIELNATTGNVTVSGQQINLTRKEFAILELLLRHPGSVFDGNAIMERVWPSDSDTSPEIIRCHITRLRRRLAEASATAGESIRSVYGMGYKLEA